MTQTSFTCPHCGGSIDFSQIEQHAINITKKELELEFARKEEQNRLLQQKQAEEMKLELWKKAQEAAKKKAEEENQEKLLELQNLRERDEISRKKELEFLKEKQELENRQKNLEIEKERALIDMRKKMEEDFAIEAAKRQSVDMERMKLDFDKRIAEEVKKAEILKRALDDATMKANQGSMQIQGDAQENALRDALNHEFPIDTIEDVPTGVKWADLIQTVRTARGENAGIIAWESKNAKAWSEGWVQKLKEDRLIVNAAVSIIVTNVLPEGIDHFGPYKGIWVTEWQFVIPLTTMLREQLIQMQQLKGSLVGKDEKMEVLYGYLTSPEFRDKIQNIVETFESLRLELDRERRAMEAIWARREKQLARVIKNTGGLYGEMQGLLGSEFKGVPAFELASGESEVEIVMEAEE